MYVLLVTLLLLLRVCIGNIKSGSGDVGEHSSIFIVISVFLVLNNQNLHIYLHLVHLSSTDTINLHLPLHTGQQTRRLHYYSSDRELNH